MADIPGYYLMMAFILLFALLAMFYFAFSMTLPVLSARLRFLLEQRRWPELETEVENGRISPFELYIRKGLACFDNVMIARAITYFQEAIVAHPLSPEGHYFLGLAYLNSPYYRGAEVEEAFHKALERREDHAEARFMLGMFYLELGLYSRVTEELSRLPREFTLPGIGYVLGKPDISPLESGNLIYPRQSRSTRIFLAFLCLLQFGILGVLISQKLWLFMGIIVVMFLLQAWWFGQMGLAVSLSAAGITIHNWFRSLHFTWEDVRDLISEQGRGIWLVLKGHPVFISSSWCCFEDLVRQAKAQLYFRHWRASCSDFRRPHWVSE